MKRETIFKVILVLSIAITLFINPVNVLATDGATSLDDLWTDYEDQGGLTDLQPGTTTVPNTDTTPSTQTTPSTSTQQKEELPKAGLVEDTIMVIALAVLGTTAVYTFKKSNEYNNI